MKSISEILGGAQILLGALQLALLPLSSPPVATPTTSKWCKNTSASIRLELCPWGFLAAPAMVSKWGSPLALALLAWEPLCVPAAG